MADIPGFDDYSAAMDRLRSAGAAGQELDPADADIVRRGDATHGQRYDAQQQPPTPSAGTSLSDLPVISAPGPDQGWRSDPYSWQSYATRAATNVIAGIPDLLTTGADVAMHAYDAARGSPNVPRPGYEYPTEYPSQALRRLAGVPELPQNASTGQKALDIASTLAGLAGPGAISRGLSAAPGIINAVKAAGGSFFRNAVVAPAVSSAAAAAANEVGGEPAAFAASLIGPQIASPEGARAAIQAFENWRGRAYARDAAPQTRPGERVQKPGALDVAKAAADLGLDPSKFPTFGMLANPEGQQVEGALAATPLGQAAKSALYAQRPMFEDEANNLLLNRRAIPAATPGNVSVVAPANAARAAAIAQGVPEVEASAMPAVEQFWTNNLGHNPEIDVTNAANTLRQMYMNAGDLPTQNAIRARYNQLTNRMTTTGNILDPLNTGGIASTITGTPGQPGGRIFVPWNALRQFRTGLGAATANIEGLKGDALRQAYGAVTSDMRNGAAPWVSPEAFDAANLIEHNEYAAKDLQTFLDKTLLNKSAAYASNFGNAIDRLKEDRHEFERLMGGEYDPTGPPAPSQSGDIRKQAYDLATIGKASYVPGQQYERPTPVLRTLWELAKGGGFGGIGTILAHAAGLPFEAAAVGIPAGVAWPYLKSRILESPATKNPMMGQPQPPIPSMSLSPADAFAAAQAANQQEKLRQAIFGEGNVPKATRPPDQPYINPYSLPPASGAPGSNPYSIPGRQSFRDLPTTRPLLNAFIGGNVGRSRAETAA